MQQKLTEVNREEKMLNVKIIFLKLREIKIGP
jgi:hypothetical protein